MSSKCTKTARSICDLLLFVALLAAIFLLQRYVQPYKRGFFCGDESLGYPLRESSFSTALTIGIALAVPTVVILVVELCKQLPSSAQGDKGCRLTQRLLQLYKQAGYYLFGLGMLTFVLVLTKLCAGRLRPHFYAVCQPVLPDGSSCANAQNHGRLIDSYTCSNFNSSAALLAELNQSFPSGHSGLTMYAMLYLAIYLQAVLSTRISKLLKHLLQFVFVVFAWYVSLTRVNEYFHHWSDVLAGLLLGALFASLISVYVADLFAYRRWQRGGYGTLRKPQISPKSSAKSAAVATAPAAALPAYTFGTLPYLTHAHPAAAAAAAAAQAQYAQTYHNYGYVP